MMVMPANWSKSLVHYLAGKYPDYLGHLYSPGAQRGPYKWLPYALDNGRFSCWSKGAIWNEAEYLQLLTWAKASGQKPRWILVPDVVADREATIKEWSLWSTQLREYGAPLAFAVQDGMTPADIPSDADVIFVGGSTEWKWKTVESWCDSHPRVHVGRVNTYGKLIKCKKYGAESCDGTGWTRGDKYQLDGLLKYLAEEAGERTRADQPRLWDGIAA